MQGASACIVIHTTKIQLKNNTLTKNKYYKVIKSILVGVIGKPKSIPIPVTQ